MTVTEDAAAPTDVAAPTHIATPHVTAREAAVEQAMVAATQVAAGVGNFAFAALAARVLDAPGFAVLAAFLAMYMVIHVPSAALAAARAGRGSSPSRGAATVDRMLMTAGGVMTLTVVVLVGPLSVAFGLPRPLVVMLAGAVATAPLLGVARGRAYAQGHVRAIGTSLVAEPAARLLVGLPLALAFGSVGAAFGPVAGGWLALAALRRAAVKSNATAVATAPGDTVARANGAGVASMFVVFAVLQSQDLLLANRLLPSAEAGRFAVVSTVGGIVAFATATIPYVLLPRARAGRRSDLHAAITVAVGIGGAATAIVALLPSTVFSIAFGASYTGVDELAVRYLLAMTALGVARVIGADRCARGYGGAVVGVAVVAAVLHAGFILLFTHSAGGIANASLAVMVLLVAGLVAVRPDVLDRLRTNRPRKLAMVGAVAVAFALRLFSDRGLWVDEAITAQLASQSFDGMLDQLRSVDVHPPLHAVLVWFTAQLLGTSEVAVRLPSVIAGAALVPMVFGATRAMYDRRTAVVAASLSIVAPLLVWYSQEARMYSLFMVLAVAAVWAQVEALRGGTRRAWVVFALTTAAMVWTQYFTVLVVGVQQVAVLVVIVRAWCRGDAGRAVRLLKGWGLAVGLVVLLLVPLAPFVGDQVSAYGQRRGSAAMVPSTAGAGATAVAGDGISIYAVFANGVWAVLGFHADDAMAKLVALWPVLVLLVLGSLGRRRQPITTYVAALATIPAAVLFVVGLEKRDLFELRYFAATAPLGVILVARLITTVARARVAAMVATFAATMSLGLALADQQLNGANPRRYDFKGALSEIESRAEPGDTLVYAPTYLGSVIDYYGDDMRSTPIGPRPPTRDGGVFVMATFRTTSERAIAAQVGDELARLDADRDLVGRFDRANVRVWEFR